jgi:hypothetical protein
MKLRCCFLLVLTFLVPLALPAQTPESIAFGCGEQRTDFNGHPSLVFEPITAPEAIREWQSRPVLAFTGFAVAKYGFNQVRFYRWRVPVPGREDNEQSFNHNSSQRLDLAVQVTKPQGPSWFHLVAPRDTDDLLYFQPDPGDRGSAEEPPSPEASEAGKVPVTKPQDEMEAWLTLKLASPNQALPVFLLDFAYNDSGANAAGTIRNELLVDFENGVPRVARTARCILWEGGGVCGAPDTGNAVYDQLTCTWDPAVEDFHCVMVSAYGGAFAPLTAQRDFYLLSPDKVAKPAWYAPTVAPDLARLATRLRGNAELSREPQLVAGLGPATLIAQYSDLLADAEVFVFASPAASDKIASRFTMVTLPARGNPVVQPVSKWDISGEKTDEADPPAGYTPVRANHKLHARSLESQPGFRAIEVVLLSQPAGGGPPIHVVYWLGIEVASGSLLANSVRLASEGTSYGGCGHDVEDGTATSIQRKPAVAEATVRVQAQAPPMLAENEPQPCPWTGVVHWKAGSGFRIRKTGELCHSPARNVSITDDGAVTSKPRPKEAS